MRPSVWLIPVVLFFALAALLYVSLGRDTETLPSALIDKPVPAFELTELLDNQVTYTQDIFKGRWSLLNVWGSWCPTCYVEHPYFMQLAEQGVDIVGVNYKDNKAKAEKYLMDLGNPYSEIIVDNAGDFALDLGVYGAPETYLVNPEGVILVRHAGELDAQVWEEKFLPLMPDSMDATVVPAAAAPMP